MKNEIIRLTRSMKVGIIVSVFGLFFSLFVPLWQQGVNVMYRRQLALAKAKVLEQKEDVRMLEARIASLRMPESLIEQVIEQGIDYQNIDASSAIMIARGN